MSYRHHYHHRPGLLSLYVVMTASIHGAVLMRVYQSDLDKHRRHTCTRTATRARTRARGLGATSWRGHMSLCHVQPHGPRLLPPPPPHAPPRAFWAAPQPHIAPLPCYWSRVRHRPRVHTQSWLRQSPSAQPAHMPRPMMDWLPSQSRLVESQPKETHEASRPPPHSPLMCAVNPAGAFFFSFSTIIGGQDPRRRKA